MILNDILEMEPLSKALQLTLRLAHECGATELEHWIQLELGGYHHSNSAISEDVSVPEYRTVVGSHFNNYGQRIQFPPSMYFVNETRLREGVAALESLRDTRSTVVLQDPTMIEIIAEHLKLEVSTFHFDCSELVQVLSQIRSELFRRAQVLSDSIAKLSNESRVRGEEIIMLKPNFHGMGVDLRALWRRVTRGRKYGG